jgi:pyrimidine-nucleoside phosphorylase
VRAIEDPQQFLPKAKYKMEIKSIEEGFISSMNSQKIGIAEMLSGAGRAKKEDTIEYSAGVVFYKKINEYVKKNEIIAEILYNSPSHIEEAVAMINDSYTISENKNIKRGFSKNPNVYNYCEFSDNGKIKTCAYHTISTSF